MSYMKLNRYGDPTSEVFDPAAVIEKARQAFPDVQVMPGDQLALAADRAEAAGAAEHVVRTLRRNQQEFGPAFSFEIGIGGGKVIQGRARRYDVTLLFPESLSGEWRQQVSDFLRGLGAGRIEEAADTAAETT